MAGAAGGAGEPWTRRLLATPWFLAFVPINAATAGFGVVLPLLILLPLHGTWGEVAVAATIFNAAVIGSSVLWGHLADRYPRRRLFLVVNYGGYALLYLFIASWPSVGTLYALYGVIGLIAPAGASASTLLILEKFPEPSRASAYGSFQMISIVGSMAGLLLGYLWTTDAYSLYPLLDLLAALAAVSAIAIWLLVSEGARPARTTQVARHPESLMARVRQSASFRVPIPFFPVRPRLTSTALRRFVRWGREELRHELPLVLASMFLFNFSSNVFNISLTPYLTSAGVAASSIFLVNFANSAGQGLAFPFSGLANGRVGPDRLVRISTYVRSLSYLATAGFSLAVLAAPQAFAANLTSYAVAGGAIAFFTVASSMMLFRSLRGRDSGRVLGVNSALGGVAAVLGAAFSGIVAVVGSFTVAFLVAAGGLLASLPLWAAATLAYRRRHADPAAAGPGFAGPDSPPPPPGEAPAPSGMARAPSVGGARGSSTKTG
ncbi:MAG: MFS transporter [Thermoplasmata archaeon]